MSLRVRLVAAAASTAILFFAGPVPADEIGWVEVEMKYVPWKANRSKEGYEHLPMTCPRSLAPGGFVQQGQQQFMPISGVGSAGRGIPVTTLETSVEMDTDADGKVDAKAKGKDSCVQFRLKSDDGTAYDYMARITRCEITSSSVQWVYQRSCFMEGTFDKTRIRLIDDDNDGVYGRAGQDAIAIGNSADHAVPVGPVVSVNDKVYHLRVHPSGTRLSLKAYEGPTGRLDATSKYQSNGKLVWAAFRAGESWFDAATAGKGGLLVPAGTYRFQMGRIYSRPQGARIKAGKMDPVEVPANETAVVAWGGPLTAQFQYGFEGRILKIAPNGPACGMAGGDVAANGGCPFGADPISVEGKGGEVYWRFEPEDFTPKVVIRRKDNKKPVHKGNCILRADHRTYHPAWWMWRNEYSEQVKNEEGPFEAMLEEDQFGKLFPGLITSEWK